MHSIPWHSGQSTLVSRPGFKSRFQPIPDVPRFERAWVWRRFVATSDQSREMLGMDLRQTETS